jgi:hypothetical protein
MRHPLGVSKGDDFSAALGIGLIIWVEGFIDRVQEDSTNAIGMGRAALGEGNEVINIHIASASGGRPGAWTRAMPGAECRRARTAGQGGLLGKGQTRWGGPRCGRGQCRGQNIKSAWPVKGGDAVGTEGRSEQTRWRGRRGGRSRWASRWGLTEECRGTPNRPSGQGRGVRSELEER